jgi:hypothetical protein
MVVVNIHLYYIIFITESEWLCIKSFLPYSNVIWVMETEEFMGGRW